MKKNTLKSIETIQENELNFVNGGLAADSKRWDSKTKDSKKGDTYTSLESAN